MAAPPPSNLMAVGTWPSEKKNKKGKISLMAGPLRVNGSNICADDLCK